MRVLYVTGSIVVLDQITKLLVKGFTISFLDFYHPGMQLGASIPIFGDFLRLTFIENPGMAFGIDIGGRLFLTIFSIIASAGILVYLYRIREETLAVRIPLAMILGGAIGNLIDRVFYGVIFGESSLFYGKVVDFIDVDFFNIDFVGFHISRWPVFNIADASVSIGVLILLVFHRKFTSVEEPQVSLASTTQQSSTDGMKNGSSGPSSDVSTPTPS
ncbi:MAG: signal peptidase II [Ignavibacteriales bacterium]|nr:signal peptidase II [Ignavibacteriales bacterium]